MLTENLSADLQLNTYTFVAFKMANMTYTKRDFYVDQGTMYNDIDLVKKGVELGVVVSYDHFINATVYYNIDVLDFMFTTYHLPSVADVCLKALCPSLPMMWWPLEHEMDGLMAVVKYLISKGAIPTRKTLQSLYRCPLLVAFLFPYCDAKQRKILTSPDHVVPFLTYDVWMKCFADAMRLRFAARRILKAFKVNRRVCSL